MWISLYLPLFNSVVSVGSFAVTDTSPIIFGKPANIFLNLSSEADEINPVLTSIGACSTNFPARFPVFINPSSNFPDWISSSKVFKCASKRALAA